MSDRLMWWGYEHTNGSLQAKRYFHQSDISEALESPFVKTIVRPFDAETREQALEHIAKMVGVTK